MLRHRKPKFVNVYKDRHGKERIYYRRPGHPQVALPGPLYCEAFWIAYHAAANDAPVPVGVSQAPSGSVSAVIAGYYGSAEFKTLAPLTRRTYGNTLERFRKDFGDLPIAKMRTQDVNAVLDSMADTPAAAQLLRKRLSQLFDYAIGAGIVADNPVKTAKRIRKKAVGHRTWTESDIEAFRGYWSEETPQRLAMELLLFTGLRRSDAVRIGWQHVSDDRIRITAQKTGVELDIPIHEILAGFLDRCPRDLPTFIITAYGKPRSALAFTGFISDAAKQAGLPPRSSPHGLRKAACRRLAEAGASTHEIMSITGHTNVAEIETYTKAVENKKLSGSAMAKMASMFDQKLPNPISRLDNTSRKSLKTLAANRGMVLPRGIEPLFPP